jgi:MFS family permease
VIAAHGLHTGSLDLIAPQLLTGIGIGMIVSPLFGFILAAVRTEEVGSASGVLTAVQQLGAALGVAALGTLFFSAVTDDGFVAAITHSLVAELATMPVLFVLISLLPRQAREEGEETVATSGQVERVPQPALG